MTTSSLPSSPALAPGNPFEPLRRGKVYEQVAGQLQRWIATELKPGDKLPTERQLVEMFGVSRSSIRDALHKLQLYGLVETRQGIGTVVRQPADRTWPGVLAAVLTKSPAELDELLDFRRILEPALAARAAVHASVEEIAELRQILERQAAKTRAKEPAVEEDAEFHYTIALAANNTVVLSVLDTIMSLLDTTRAEQFQSQERAARSLAGHRAILAAIEQHDAAAAEKAMHAHLQAVEEIIAHHLNAPAGGPAQAAAKTAGGNA